MTVVEADGPCKNTVFRPLHIHRIDLDGSRKTTTDHGGVIQAARSFLRNDPYHPRPRSANSADELEPRPMLFHRRFLTTNKCRSFWRCVSDEMEKRCLYGNACH
ncbi:hypothetical protein DCS_03192 [Drechmeria coniospora]|uniref:DUF3669 domain-containing protein n=1 Tax=Drechmeria coniospora TaxID=98403 RepID=A0A151GY77_DRECN|nr:hypothetical protein DCS_03192 [Drechmeria coniospora]KYK62047.1 hypothetical protein DCS_03192 [Drechmeria coniospora]